MDVFWHRQHLWRETQGVHQTGSIPEFKARVAMAALSGEKTLAELSAEFGVHPTMISDWKQELVKRAGELSL